MHFKVLNHFFLHRYRVHHHKLYFLGFIMEFFNMSFKRSLCSKAFSANNAFVFFCSSFFVYSFNMRIEISFRTKCFSTYLTLMISFSFMNIADVISMIRKLMIFHQFGINSFGKCINCMHLFRKIR